MLTCTAPAAVGQRGVNLHCGAHGQAVVVGGQSQGGALLLLMSARAGWMSHGGHSLDRNVRQSLPTSLLQILINIPWLSWFQWFYMHDPTAAALVRDDATGQGGAPVLEGGGRAALHLRGHGCATLCCAMPCHAVPCSATHGACSAPHGAAGGWRRCCRISCCRRCRRRGCPLPRSAAIATSGALSHPGVYTCVQAPRSSLACQVRA